MPYDTECRIRGVEATVLATCSVVHDHTATDAQSSADPGARARMTYASSRFAASSSFPGIRWP